MDTTPIVLLVILVLFFIGWLITIANNFDLKHHNKELMKKVLELQQESVAYKIELAKHNDHSLFVNAEIIKNKVV